MKKGKRDGKHNFAKIEEEKKRLTRKLNTCKSDIGKCNQNLSEELKEN